MEEKGYKFLSAEVAYVPQTMSSIDDPDLVVKMEKLIDMLEENDDVQEIWHNDGDQILAFSRKDLIFVFNFSPNRSFTDYGLLVPEGSYSIVLNTDAERFGGNALVDETQKHFTQYDKLHARRKKGWLQLYLPARTALVLKKNRKNSK